MNIDNLKAMLELTAMQNLNNPYSSSLFQDMLNELLLDEAAASSGSFLPPITASKPASPVNSLAKPSLPPLSLLKAGNQLDFLINQASRQNGVPARAD